MGKERIVLLRQRPSMGDALLLSPLVRCLKVRHPNSILTVITDGLWSSGALTDVFSHMPGVDRVESIPAVEWTTDTHKALEPFLKNVHGDLPVSVRKADRVYDCNSAFIEFERQSAGKPAYGIAEFWVRHFGFDPIDVDLRPQYQVTEEEHALIDNWFLDHSVCRPLVGVVLRAGHEARNWDFNGLSTTLIHWLHSRGLKPITIDPTKSLNGFYELSFVGKRVSEVAALLTRCKFVITPDTGILHLAEAVKTPTVALWGIMDPDLRVKGYNTTVIPQQSLGVCRENEQCQCTWKFQQWSCLRRLRPHLITTTLEGILNGLQGIESNPCGHPGNTSSA